MAKKTQELTPMMQQFFSLKAKHPDRRFADSGYHTHPTQ